MRFAKKFKVTINKELEREIKIISVLTRIDIIRRKLW